ncbi:DgyrCDS6182 [Dimorphilus gyrociliatus]|uniref:DgyrCDS6182 n=1 Tax=Dimorphilus gyrociliatus TaxID=2664684 RepID=A0A7I8VNW8_9ANNE|nr:DgyrCDS6182 [Dimorphilus gyrociliatus]
MDSYESQPDAPGSTRLFMWWVLVAQVFGLTSVILVAVWMGHYRGGFAWQGDPTHQFNYHPLFMVIGMIFLYGDGLKAVFDSHNLKKKPDPNLYSLHSWVGLMTIIFFGFQWVAGFVTFLWPGLALRLKNIYKPIHVFWGILIYAFALAAAMMGIVEKALFSKDLKYNKFESEGILINFLGIFLLAFGGIVVYLVTNPSWKRQQFPEEQHLTLND